MGKSKVMFLVMLTVSWMVFSGCAFFQGGAGGQAGDDENLQVVAEIAARRLGVAFAQKEPELVNKVSEYCDTMLDQEDGRISAMMLYGLRYLSAKYTGDPLLADDLVSIARLLGINLTQADAVLDESRLAPARVVIAAFQTGLKGASL